MGYKLIRFGNWKCVPLVYDLSFHSLTIDSVCVCVHTCSYVCTCMYAGVHTCVEVCDQQVSPSIILHCFFFFFLKQHLSLTPELSDLSRLASQGTSEPLLALPSQHQDYRCALLLLLCGLWEIKPGSSDMCCKHFIN